MPPLMCSVAENPAFADVCTVAVTPMSADGAIDFASAERLARHIAESGVGTVTVGGSVGEVLALTRAERRDLVELFVSASDTPVIAAVAGDLGSAREDAIDAATAGAAAIMVHQPGNPFAAPDGWVAYHEHIASSIEPLPIVLYVRDAAIDETHLFALTESCRNVVAIKDAVPDPMRLARLTEALGDRLTWLCGLAETWAPFAWVAGARGFTSGLANVDAALPRQLMTCLRAGDELSTRRAWASIAPFERLRARRGGAASVGIVKAALVRRGILTTDAVRPPLSDLTGDDRAALDEVLQQIAQGIDVRR